MSKKEMSNIQELYSKLDELGGLMANLELVARALQDENEAGSLAIDACANMLSRTWNDMQQIIERMEDEEKAKIKHSHE